MILYGSSLSPFVRKVLAFAAEAGIALETVPMAPGSDDPVFRSASPLGRIPALVEGDFHLSDSTAIIVYLDALGIGARLIPDEPRARAETIRWDEIADTELFGVGRQIFFNRLVLPLFQKRPGDEAAAATAEREGLPPLMDYLERVLDGREWLVGGAISLADIAVASPFVNLRHLGIAPDAATHPRLAAYVGRMLARPSFATLIERETGFIAKVRAAAQA